MITRGQTWVLTGRTTVESGSEDAVQFGG